jgi:hypothetical protein
MSQIVDVPHTRRLYRGLTTGQLAIPVGSGNETMTDEGRRLAGADFGRMATPSKTIAQGYVHR